MLDAVEDGIGQAIGGQELPSGVFEQHDSMSASCHTTRDFLDVQLHAGRAGE